MTYAMTGQADRIVVTRWRAGQTPRSDLVTHTEHVLGFVVDGACVMECGCTANAAAGDLIVVPAGVPHRGRAASATDCWTVGFCATCLGLDETQRLMSPFARVRRGGVPVATVAAGRRRKVVRLFRELDEEGQRAAPESPELSKALLFLLLGEAVRATNGRTEPVSEGSLSARALEYIQKNATSGISLRDVARVVHRTPAHLAATVKAETGHTVGAWITSARLAEAAAGLRHTDLSLQDIAEQAGYQDTTHFIRQFKRAYGATPVAWRREQRRAPGATGAPAAHPWPSGRQRNT